MVTPIPKCRHLLGLLAGIALFLPAGGSVLAGAEDAPAEETAAAADAGPAAVDAGPVAGDAADPDGPPEASDAVAAESGPGGGDAAVSGVDPDAGADGESGEEEAVEPGGDPVAGETPEPDHASPQDALVAVRGDARVGLGALVSLEGRDVVLTSLSALDGSRRIVVNDANGTVVPVRGIIGASERDLAVLLLGETEEDLPLARVRRAASIEPGQSLSILLPREKIAVEAGEAAGDRIQVDRLDGPVYPGCPVSRNGSVIGVFSPARTIGIESSGSRDESRIWPTGVVLLPERVRWETIDLPTMAAERDALRDITGRLREVGTFLGVRREGEVTYQPLLAARRRLNANLARFDQEVERDRARRSFVFSVRSAAGNVESELGNAVETYYGYFVPEIRMLTRLYEPIGKELRKLSRDPGKADSYAR